MPYRSRAVLTTGFVIVAAATLVVAGIALQSVRRARQAQAWLDHTRLVLAQLEDTLTIVINAESTSVEYQVDGDPQHLSAIARVGPEITASIDRLASLTANNPAQTVRIAEVRQLTEAAVSRVLAASEARRLTGGNPPAVQQEESAAMLRLRDSLRAMRVEEERLLEDRMQPNIAALRLFAPALVAIAVLACVLLAATYALLVGSLRRRQELAFALERSHEALEARVVERTAALSGALLREQETREAAQSANRLKDEFLMTVSHELRTPLTAIYGWARMFGRGQLREGQTQRAVEAIERNAEALTRLVNDLLDVSRITSGKLRLDTRPLDIRSVIEAAIEAMVPAAVAKNIRIERELDAPSGPMLGDPDRLQQVVWNLLSNAVKFTPPGGTVRVTLTIEDREMTIAVTDTGPGVPAEFLPFVFDRFRQADATTTRRHGGLGLGLAIVRHLVELHGGTATAANTPEGGATFAVHLPRGKALSPTVRTSPSLDGPPADGPSPLARRRILIVDDEEEARALFTAALRHAGADVRTVESVAQAVEAAKAWKPDVVLSDIEMPGEDGYALARRLREVRDGHGNGVVAIAITAHTRMEDRRRAAEAGFAAHLSKPIDPAELVAAVGALMRPSSPDRA